MYYPVYLNLNGKHCVIIGGGNESAKKLEHLLNCGARITIISPKISPDIRQRVEKNEVAWKARPYRRGDIKNAYIAIAATNQMSVNQAVAEEAKLEKTILNVVDVTDLCDFIAPAIIKRGDVIVAISTGGASPALARRLREEISQCTALEYADLAKILRTARSEVKKRKTKVCPDRWQECIDRQLLTMVQNGQSKQALERLMNCLIPATTEGRIMSCDFW